MNRHLVITSIVVAAGISAYFLFKGKTVSANPLANEKVEPKILAGQFPEIQINKQPGTPNSSLNKEKQNKVGNNTSAGDSANGVRTLSKFIVNGNIPDMTRQKFDPNATIVFKY